MQCRRFDLVKREKKRRISIEIVLHTVTENDIHIHKGRKSLLFPRNTGRCPARAKLSRVLPSDGLRVSGDRHAVRGNDSVTGLNW